VAGDDRVAEGPPLAHPELDLAVPHVAVELHERARVEQLLDPLAREQLALRALPLDGALARLVRRLLAVRQHPLELGLRGIAGRRHGRSLPPSLPGGLRD